jgi:hypothetical protein
MATQTSTQSTSLPPWLDSAYQDLLSRAGTASQQGYQPYVDASGNPIPRIAGFSQDQLNAFQQVRDAQGRGDSTFGQAQGMITGAGGLSSLGAAQKYMDAAGGGSALSAAQPYINAAGGNFGSRAAQPYFDQSAGMSGAGAANPLVSRGTGSWTDNSAAYMSPYTQQVTDRIAQLGQRNLSENLLPAVNKTFIGGGQFGSRRNSDFTNRAVRDANESILGQQAQALESGYKTAADIYGQDASRQLQGGLGLGQLTSADASRIADIGKSAGSLMAGDLDRQLSMASLAGNLANSDRSSNLQLASLAGGLTNNDATRQLQAGNALSALGTSRQNYDLSQANALSGIGQQQQQLGQSGLNTAYGDFQTQQGWNKNNLSWLSSILSGSAKPTTTTTTAPGASTGSQILGGLTSGFGLLGATGAFGDDGWISSLFAEGGRVQLARGGLARPAYAAGGAVDYTTMPDDVLQKAANSGDIGAFREVNRRQNPDRPGYRNLSGTRNEPYQPGFNQSAILPAIKDAASATFDELSKPVGERGGLAPSLADMRSKAPDYSGFSGAYPRMDEMPMGGLSVPLPGRKPAPPMGIADAKRQMGAFASGDPLQNAGDDFSGRASPLTGQERESMNRLSRLGVDVATAGGRDPYLDMTPEQQVRQDIMDEVGPSPGPVPMGGLSAGAQPPTGGAPQGGLSAPADAGGGDDRWGADSDIWSTLIAAGAGAMSSKSPSMLGGIGEGLTAGLKTAQAQKDNDLKQGLLERQQANDDARLGMEGRRVNVAEQREKREAASDLLALSGAGDKNQPAQAKMIKFLMDGGMTREEATDRVFGAKTDPLERAKLVGTMAKIYAEGGDEPDAALEKARKTVDALAPGRTAAKGAGSNSGIKVGTQARRGDGSIIVWDGKAWVPQGAAK